jgi:hypothetical protein
VERIPLSFFVGRETMSFRPAGFAPAPERWRLCTDRVSAPPNCRNQFVA